MSYTLSSIHHLTCHVFSMLQLATPDQITGIYKATNFSARCNNNIKQCLSYKALRESLQAIYIGDVHVIITFVSVKQVYNDKVKLSTKLSHSVRKFFHSVPAFSHVQYRQNSTSCSYSNKIADSFMDMIVQITYIPIVQLYQ